MRILTLLVLLSFFCVSIFGFSKLEQLSTSDAVNILRLMDDIKNNESDTDLKQLFKELTDLDFNNSLREVLYDLIEQNQNHSSVFMRLAGLITFKNIFLTCMVIVAVALIISVFKDIIVALGSFVGLVIVQIILDKRFLYTVGLGFSGFMMYIDPQNIENKFIRYLFILDWLTPLFGCFIFGIIAFVMYNDLVKTTFDKLFTGSKTQHGGYTEENNYVPIGLIVTLVWTVVTIYHQNWVIGIFTIMMMYFTFGFAFGTMPGGYYTGFAGTAAMIRCFVVSLILNALTIGMKMNFVSEGLVEYLDVFETGMRFSGTFVGCLAMLIMCDERFILKMNDYKRESILPYFIMMQVFMGSYSLGLMYFGSIFDIITFKSIGGTFLVLWGLDLEYTVLHKFSKGYRTMALVVIMANMVGLYHLMSWYPEYFIFSW